MNPLWCKYIRNTSLQMHVVLSDPDIEQAGNISQDFYHCFTDKRKAHDKDEQPWGKRVETRVSGFLIPFEPFALPSPVGFSFLGFYPNIFSKRAGFRVIEHTLLGGFPSEPTGFQLLLFTLTQFFY